MNIYIYRWGGGERKKGESRNLICKLLLNSLYGRFGMSPYLEAYKFDDYTLRNEPAKDILILFEDIGLVSYMFSRNTDVSKSKGYYLNISLPIAMAVTAYARMHMYQYKQLLGDNLLYSDTDSIFSCVPLPEFYVGNKLGQMKLEYIGIRAAFPAPKVYAVELEDGSVIKKVRGAKENILEQLNMSHVEYLININ